VAHAPAQTKLADRRDVTGHSLALLSLQRNQHLGGIYLGDLARDRNDLNAIEGAVGGVSADRRSRSVANRWIEGDPPDLAAPWLSWAHRQGRQPHAFQRLALVLFIPTSIPKA
jgi:hypothetical protein